MDPETDPENAVTSVVARRVRQVRSRHGLTAKQVVERLRDQGIDWTRPTLVKLENGRRQSVSVAELLALALVLDVAPVHLLVPPENSPYPVTPERTEPANDVRAWVRGERPLAGVDERMYRTEVSVAELRGEDGPEARAQSTSDVLRRLADHLDATGEAR